MRRDYTLSPRFSSIHRRNVNDSAVEQGRSGNLQTNRIPNESRLEASHFDVQILLDDLGLSDKHAISSLFRNVANFATEAVCKDGNSDQLDWHVWWWQHATVSPIRPSQPLVAIQGH